MSTNKSSVRQVLDNLKNNSITDIDLSCNQVILNKSIKYIIYVKIK